MLKQVLLTKVFPILLACLAGLFFYNHQNNEVIFSDNYPVAYKYENYSSDYAVHNVVSAINSKNTILLIGSSELGTIPTELNARADLFFQEYHTGFSLVSLGHAGNQSFSIYTQLMAYKDYIPNSKICIIISPGWFSNSYKNGTSLESFLEFNNRFFLSEVCSNPNDSLKQYVFNYIANNINDIQNPLLIHKLMNDYSIQSNSILRKIFQYPIFKYHQFLLKTNETSLRKKYSLDKLKNIDTICVQTAPIKWDSIKQVSVNLQKANSTNNKWYINNEYYTKYTKGQIGHHDVSDLSKNQELKDFRMLLYLLNYYKVDASFVIQPLNPYAYDNLSDLKPVLMEIEREIKEYNYPLNNMFVYDTASYQPGILTDVSHLGEYGWFTIDEFLINTYEKE
jgi:D-alanine transfer protein